MGQDGEVLPSQHHDADARSNRRLRLLTPGFNLAGHFCALGAITLAGSGAGIWLARHAQAEQVWIVPAYILLANVVEYLVHRFLMHRPLWPRPLYRGHTLGHHRAFRHDSMPIETWREIELVMMPWFTIALLFTALTPVVVVVDRTLGSGAAGLLLLTAIVSFITYEGMHTLYHLPVSVLDGVGLSRNRLFQARLRHHQHHHRLARMRWVNFNISLPVCDSLLGTRETEAEWLARREECRDARHVERASAGAEGEDRDRPSSPADRRPRRAGRR